MIIKKITKNLIDREKKTKSLISSFLKYINEIDGRDRDRL